MTETMGVRKVLISEELAASLFARDADGNCLSVKWGEPNADGLYVPVLSVDNDVVSETHAAGSTSSARRKCRRHVWKMVVRADPEHHYFGDMVVCARCDIQQRELLGWPK